MKIGIDVGGTHTDAVILDGDRIIAATKAKTSADVISGITDGLDKVLADGGVKQEQIAVIMIGTTQFTNAIIERRELSPVAAIRIGLPSGKGMPPMVGWPADICDAIETKTYELAGGFLYDGAVLAQMDDDAVAKMVADIGQHNIKNVAISSVFSPMKASPEHYVAKQLEQAIPDIRVTLSSSFGRLGLLERENAAILNSTLLPFADNVVSSFLAAIKKRGLNCPVFISQNDGTLMNAEFVRAFPALTFASGPTNSLRGASKLTGLADAIVVDIGGTTSDIGVLQGGFPRESNSIIEVGDVRTNFRMPDILSLGLGGGSLVCDDGTQIGPKSLGHRLTEEALIFGGNTLTATDILVASGGNDEIGDASLVADIDANIVATAQATMTQMLDLGIEKMKPGGKSMPVILVGGGAVLVSGALQAASQIHRPKNAGVANAIGAAIAQIGGEAERLVNYRDITRDEAIAQITDDATQKAVRAGADKNTIRAVDIEETAIPYMDNTSTRVRIKVIGDIAGAAL